MRATVTSVPAKRTGWVLLAYRLPRDPSTPRSTLWRKLRRLGAAQVLDGFAALPLDARNREQLEWLADEVIEAGGGGGIWIGGLAPAGPGGGLAPGVGAGGAAGDQGLSREPAGAARAR